MVSLKGAGLRFASAFLLENEDTVMAWIKSYLLERLLKVSPPLLSDSIKGDLQIWGALPKGHKNALRNIAGSKASRQAVTKYAGMITAEVILKWMVDPYGAEEEPKLTAQQRQDRRHWQALASVIVNYPGGKGAAWLHGQVTDLKRSFTDAMDGVEPQGTQPDKQRPVS